MFVDLHISNTSRKTIKRTAPQLEKAIFCFDHAATSTTTEAANHLRYQNRTEKEIVQDVVTRKARHSWKASHLKPMRFGLELSLCRQDS